jgi:outer membrane protein OmpA-like peptidoglycan-associated protein/Tol biopolymer transport system component
MKIFQLIAFFIAFLTVNQLFAQNYTTANKKAIQFFEDASKLMVDRQFELSLGVVEKAIEKDPLFVEAYLLQSDVFIELRRYEEAIIAIEKSIEINAEYFPNKYLTLGSLRMQRAEYAEALKAFNYFLLQKKVRPELLQRAQIEKNNCEFAIEAIKNPVNFNPVNMGEGVNSWMAEYYPSMTVDGAQLLYTREFKQSPERQGRGQEDFYLSRFDGKTWSLGIPVQEINTEANEGAPTIAPDGQSMVFTACDLYGSYGPDRNGYGSCDLFYSYKIGDRWSKPKNMGPEINTGNWESQPSLSADGRTLYFVRGSRNQNERTPDIYMSTLGEDGSWAKPVILSKTINTPYSEESVLIHPDGKTLYFSSNGHPGMGGLDIFVSRKIGENQWTEPLNIGYPINTQFDENSLLVTPMGKIAIYASNRPGGFGDLDLYSFELPQEARPDPVSNLNGVVYDADSKKRLIASIELIDVESGEVVVRTNSGMEGDFLVALPYNRKYALNASKKGYLFYSGHFDLKEGSAYAEGKRIEVPLSKVSEGQTLVLNNIFFDTDKFDLKPESTVELNKLVQFLQSNMNVKIEIGGHTDNQGSVAHNQTLSDYRASSVRNYLVKAGIDTTRLTARGYGSGKPINSNDTEQGRADNRRTEMKIVATE